jgi:hypothetical protein
MRDWVTSTTITNKNKNKKVVKKTAKGVSKDNDKNKSTTYRRKG